MMRPRCWMRRETTLTSQATSPEANIELIRAGFQAFNAHDLDACMTRLAPDVIINLAELPEPLHGIDLAGLDSINATLAALGLRHTIMALGFPRSGIQVAAKCGSLLGVIRNEVGVITMPGGRRYAAAVFTRADRPYDNEHEINAALGTAAARAVGYLSHR